uniref:Metal transporter CNNM4 n=1 Tax=Cacopsylla melanoneura TaxID=428564 RepID=A0A8D8LJS2_9HEMI
MVQAFIWLVIVAWNVFTIHAIHPTLDEQKILHHYNNYIKLKREITNQNSPNLANQNSNNATTERISPRAGSNENIVLYGIQLVGGENGGDINAIPEANPGEKQCVEVFASGLTHSTYLALSENNSTCDELSTKPALVELSHTGRSGQVFIQIPDDVAPGVRFYFCAKSNGSWYHLGSQAMGVSIGRYPLWVQCFIMVVCLIISFIFSALNLGLMALDVHELQMLISSGTTVEKKYASKILPVRKNGNYLLCCILLLLTFTNAIFTTILDSLTSGIIAVALTTITLVIIGEILPQSIGSRYGLAIGAHTIYMTYVAMWFTFPLAYPMGKALDFLLGEEIGSIKTRENLKALVHATSNLVALKRDEVNIISGALEMSQKKVEDIMTKLEDCFMLDIETILDFTVISDIVRTGYSRVPVYEGKRTKIVSIIMTKDMAVIDPDDNLPLKTLCQLMPYVIYNVPVGTTLDILFKNFKDGIRGHMAFVTKKNEEGEEIMVGLVTFEDVIEEIIQEEINDETDMYVDNRSTRRRQQRRLMQEFMKYTENFGKQQVRVSPQMILAAYQFLCTAKHIGRNKNESVQPFLPENISPNVLWQMLQYDIYRRVKPNETEESIIYQEGKSADYFVMILEGRVTVKVGVEQLEFESGPFTCFGTHALIKEMGSVPDYTVIASSELTYLKINRDLYSAGLNASSIARARERAKQRGEDSAMSFPPSPDLPRDDRFSSLYQTTSYESIPAQERERQDSTRRITFKKEDHREESPGKS